MAVRANRPVIALAVIAAIITAACGIGNDRPPKVTDGSAAAADGDKQEPQTGTRDNPAAPGDVLEFEEWTIVLGETTMDATEVLMAENQFNDIPDGQVPIMVEVTATYTGAESATAWIDMSIEYVSEDGKTYSDYCGVIPSNLTDAGEQYPDSETKSNTCTFVPEGTKGGTWKVAESFSLDDSEVFVSTK